MSYLPLSDRTYKINRKPEDFNSFLQLYITNLSVLMKFSNPTTGVINLENYKATICKSSQILVNKITVYKTFYFCTA